MTRSEIRRDRAAQSYSQSVRGDWTVVALAEVASIRTSYLDIRDRERSRAEVRQFYFRNRVCPTDLKHAEVDAIRTQRNRGTVVRQASREREYCAILGSSGICSAIEIAICP